VVSADTRAPGDQLHGRAGLSTTQMRVTVDGPLGSDGAGFLWSARSAFPGFPTPQRDPTYLRGETGDQLGKIEANLGGGRLRLLGYGSGSELNTYVPGPDRNTFDWSSSTFGASWHGPLGANTGSLDVRAWLAGQNANAAWHPESTAAELLATQRRDAGVAVTLERFTERGRTALGMRAQSSRMGYRVATDSGGARRYGGATPLIAGYFERAERLGDRGELLATVGATAAAGALRLSPRMWLAWSPSAELVISSGYIRTHQFAQSLRNPESVAGAVFPVDLFVGANRSGVPIARSDEAILAAQYRPGAALHLTAQGYVRSFDDVVLVAPRSRDPFAIGSFEIGSGRARGVAVDLTRTVARYSTFVSYGLQDVRFRYQAGSYAPDYATTHSVDAGIMLHASRALSFRAAASGRFGRR